MCMQHSHTSKHALFMNDNMKGSAYPCNLGEVEPLRRSPAKPPSRVPCLMLKCAAQRTGVYQLVVSRSWSVMWLVKVQSCFHLDNRKCNLLLKSTWGLITDSPWSFASRFIKVLSVIDILEIILFFLRMLWAGLRCFCLPSLIFSKYHFHPRHFVSFN